MESFPNRFSRLFRANHLPNPSSRWLSCVVVEHSFTFRTVCATHTLVSRYHVLCITLACNLRPRINNPLLLDAPEDI